MLYISIISNLKLRKFSGKIRTAFGRNHFSTSQVLTICKIIKGIQAKNFKVTLQFIDFSKALDFIHKGKMGQQLLTHNFSKETVTIIMMLYKNQKVMVCSPDGNTDFFDIVPGVLQEYILAPYLFILASIVYF